MVVGCEPDHGVHLGGTAEELQVVVRHHPALGMADDVGLRRPGGGEHLVDERGELTGRLVDRAEAVEDGYAGQLPVVERVDAVAPVD